MSDPAARFLASAQDQLLARLDLRRTDVQALDAPSLRQLLEGHARSVIAESVLPVGLVPDDAVRRLVQDALGLGVLDELLADDSISEIMVNGPANIFIERAGRLHPAGCAFASSRSLSRVVERLLTHSGRHVDEASPMVDARLADGSRINVILPPLSQHGACVTIRKFGRRRMTMEDLIGLGALSIDMARFLELAVKARCNIIVSGGTGSGKTTLLNVLSRFIPDGERIVTIEDSAELQLHHGNLVSLQARPPNAEGRGEVCIRDLVRNALRMRPDRIVIGECRGGEALDMLQAMNTGHDGSLTTAHANSPRDLLSRLEVMVLMAGMDLPVAAIREQVAGAIDLIVQQSRYGCGTRLVTQIAEVTGMEAGRIQLQDVYRHCPQGRDASGRTVGHFAHCNTVPQLAERLEAEQRRALLKLFQNGGAP